MGNSLRINECGICLWSGRQYCEDLDAIDDRQDYSFQFQYPIAGLGQFYQGIGESLQRQNQQLLLETSVTALHHHNGLIQSITTRQGETTSEHPCKVVLSSIGLTLLLKQLDPPPPPAILAAAQTLTFRSIILAYLIIDGVDLFPAHSIYVNDAQVATTRITNYANWSPQMLPNDFQTPLCCERWCELGDATWQKSDAEILAEAESELRQIGSLTTTQQVASGFVVRLPNASPVYSTAYRAAKDQIEQYLQGFANLWTIGRGGSFSYSDQDRVMLMGVTAALESIEYLQKTGCSN
jgi:protoporphyrinogen oxidase